MRATKSVSRLEKRFRQELWAAGVRGYRVETALPGRPDVAFPVERLAVFVHGCFWHVCPLCRLPKPRANAEFWAEKLRMNSVRDTMVSELLRSQGWEVRVIWEHELRRDSSAVVRGLIEMKTARRSMNRAVQVPPP